MVEKYKREGIDIVLGCRKCIYTDEKNKKFIKQNKKYIPIVKRKGEYVIINRKGGGLDIDELKITLEKLIGKLNDKIKESTGKVNDELKKIKQELTVVLTVNETLDYNKLNNIIEDYTFKIGIVLGLESSKIKKDIIFLNKRIESNNSIIDKVNYESTTKTSYADEDKIRRITSENNNMLLSVNEKVEQYDKQLLLEKEGNVKGKLHDDIPEKKTHNTIEDEKAIEQIKLNTDTETRDKKKVIKQMRLKDGIERNREYIQQLNIEIEDNDKNIKLLEIELKNPQSYVFFNDSRRATTDEKIKQLKTKQIRIKKSIISSEKFIKDHLLILSQLEEDHLLILSRLETKKKNELEWASTANPEKEQFLKEIVEKVTLSNSLEELYTNYKDKIDREGKYLNSYLNENKMNNILLFADTDKEKENYINFMLEMLLNRINDLQERIKIIEKK